MIDTIYVARHGFRMNWVTTHWKSPTGLPRDPPLAAYGVTQAEDLAKHFASMAPEDRPTAIYSSPYYRCLQTATPIAEALDLPLFVEHGVSEWYSPVKPGTGLHPRPNQAKLLKEYFDRVDTSWDSIWLPSRKGETVSEIHDRVANFLEAIVPHLDHVAAEKGHKKVLFVSHAATAIALIRELKGERKLQLRIGCCSLSTLKRTPKEGSPDQILGAWKEEGVLGDASFLPNGVERDWGFEDIVIKNGQVVPDAGVPGTEVDVHTEQDHGLVSKV